MANKWPVTVSILLVLLITLVQLSSPASTQSLRYKYTAILEFNSSKSTDYDPKQNELECKERAGHEKLCHLQPNQIRCKNRNFVKLDAPEWLCEVNKIFTDVELSNYNVTCIDGGALQSFLKGSCYLTFSLKRKVSPEKIDDLNSGQIDTVGGVIIVFFLVIFVFALLLACIRCSGEGFLSGGGRTVYSSSPVRRRRSLFIPTATSSRPYTSSSGTRVSTGFASTSFRSGGGGGGGGVSTGFASTSFR